MRSGKGCRKIKPESYNSMVTLSEIKAWFSYVADDRRVIVSDHSRRKFTKDFTHE